MPPDHAVDGKPVHGAVVRRQPILDPENTVIGYSVDVETDPTLGQAEAELVREQTLLRVRLSNLVADRVALVPITATMFAGDARLPDSADRVILGLSPGLVGEPGAVQRVQELHDGGSTVALLDYLARPQQQAALPWVDFVTITPAAWQHDAEALVEAAHSAGVRVIATGVYDHTAAAAWRALGVDLVQGAFLQHAAQRPQTHFSAGELQCLEIMRLAAEPEADSRDIAAVISTDPLLSIRVLRMVNSSVFAVRRRIDSMQHAVVLLGPQQLNALAVSSLIGARSDNLDTLWYILARAECCRRLTGSDVGYTVGMLSGTAELLGYPPTRLAEHAKVSDEVTKAVTERTGRLGLALEAVLAHETRQPERLVVTGYREAEVSAIYFAAVTDALAVATELSAAH